MEKIIKIGTQEFYMKASALTQFTYKDFTGRSFLADMKKMIELTQGNIDVNDLEMIDKINDLVLPIAYVMTREANKEQAIDYDTFLGQLDDLYEDVDWIEDLILLACSPISRQLQNNNIIKK